MNLRSRTASFYTSAQVLQVLLLLSLCLITLVSCTGEKDKNDVEPYLELRCRCMSTTSKIHPKIIQNVEVFKAGPHCASIEVVATLKGGKQICLNPEAPFVKKMIQKILEGDNSTA